ncbi:MAG: flagellar hook-length control protein FliK, partial [Synergistaceae bacterium]|nr:flagellar hook-length control protein FliK [Synergistaceae bacterium]
TPDAPEAREIPEETDAPENTHRVTPDSRTEIDSPNEITNPENQSPTQVSHSQNDYGREISEPLTRENPEITPDDETPETHPEEHPQSHPEITGDNLIMAGFAPVQTELNRPEVSAPEITDTPKTSRTQPQSPRKFQAVTHSTTDPDSDSLNDPQTVAPESPRNVQPRDIQPKNGHEGIIETETTQPSEPQSPGGISPQRVTTAAPSRTSQRTDSRSEPRTDTRRTEALNDFQAFFDSAVRTRRSTARVSTQPLSLRTGTYEAAETQSHSRTLRNGIVNVVRFIRTDGVRKANIIVDPPALGRISVELTSSSSGVEASVKVANEQIRQIVQDQFTQLRDNLLQQGVQVSEFTVDVQQDNSRQGQNSGGQNNRDNYTFTASENDDDTETFRADLEEGLLYWIA